MSHQISVRFVWIALSLSFSSGCGLSSDPGSSRRLSSLPSEVVAALEQGDSWELLSLDPNDEINESQFGLDEEPEEKIERLGRWKVLGKFQVKDKAVRDRLLTALDKGIRESDGLVAACFNPRHAIRVQFQGKTLQIFICFECLSAQIYTDAKRSGHFRTTNSPQLTFDAVLKGAGVPLPKPAHSD